MISHRHKCIFISVPKCASSSVNGSLSLHGAYWSIPPFWHGGLHIERVTRVTKLLNLYPGYFTFSFVRNPFARFLSLYYHAKRHHERKGRFVRRPIDCGSMWEFAELCEELLREKVGWGKQAEEFYEANKGRQFGPRKIPLKFIRFELGHAQLQKDFLLDYNPRTLFGVPRVNDAPCSFIGRVEHFERDLNRVLEALGIPGSSPLGRTNYTRGSKRRRYGLIYDKTLRRMVEDIYARDLDLLGYEFEDENSVSVPAPVPVARVLRESRGGFSLAKWIKVACQRAWHRTAGLCMRLLERRGFIIYCLVAYHRAYRVKKYYR